MNNNRTEITPDAVEKAVSGDRKALEELLTGIQDSVGKAPLPPGFSALPSII